MKIPISFVIDIPDPVTTKEPSTPPYIVGNLVAALEEIQGVVVLPNGTRQRTNLALYGAHYNGIEATRPDSEPRRMHEVERRFREAVSSVVKTFDEGYALRKDTRGYERLKAALAFAEAHPIEDARDDRDAMETAFRTEIDRLHVLLAGHKTPEGADA